MFNIDNIEAKLKNKGYKLTQQRRAILAVFLENPSKLLTADEIFDKAVEKFNTTNFSTVYRNLDLFVIAEIILKVDLGGSSAYELLNEDSHHHLIICKSCGKTEPIEFCPYKEISSKLKDQNFTFTDHKFELYGYCHKCKKST